MLLSSFIRFFHLPLGHPHTFVNLLSLRTVVPWPGCPGLVSQAHAVLAHPSARPAMCRLLVLMPHMSLPRSEPRWLPQYYVRWKKDKPRCPPNQYAGIFFPRLSLQTKKKKNPRFYQVTVPQGLCDTIPQDMYPLKKNTFNLNTILLTFFKQKFRLPECVIIKQVRKTLQLSKDLL